MIHYETAINGLCLKTDLKMEQAVAIGTGIAAIAASGLRWVRGANVLERTMSPRETSFH
jgi:hypothetical protein